VGKWRGQRVRTCEQLREIGGVLEHVLHLGLYGRAVQVPGQEVDLRAMGDGKPYRIPSPCIDINHLGLSWGGGGV
jgi:hypothetical protein